MFRLIRLVVLVVDGFVTVERDRFFPVLEPRTSDLSSFLTLESCVFCLVSVGSGPAPTADFSLVIDVDGVF